MVTSSVAVLLYFCRCSFKIPQLSRCEQVRKFLTGTYTPQVAHESELGAAGLPVAGPEGAAEVTRWRGQNQEVQEPFQFPLCSYRSFVDSSSLFWEAACF